MVNRLGLKARLAEILFNPSGFGKTIKRIKAWPTNERVKALLNSNFGLVKNIAFQFSPRFRSGHFLCIL